MVNAYKAIYRAHKVMLAVPSPLTSTHIHDFIWGEQRQTNIINLIRGWDIEIKEKKLKLDKFLLLFAIFHWRRERWQQVHWCDPGLRGWSVGRSPPGDPGWLKSTYKHPHPLVWAGWFLFRWPENKVSRTNGIYLVSEEWKIIHKAPAVRHVPTVS